MDIQNFFGYGSGVKKSISAHLCHPLMTSSPKKIKHNNAWILLNRS